MTTITLSVPPEAKKYIKAKAALEGTTMRDFVLRCVGWKQQGEVHEYTSDDFNEVTHAAMREDVSNQKVYDDVDELIADMKQW